MTRNFRYALRQLVHSPGFSITVVLTLALCIGANTAVFSMIDAVLLRPLPYPEPARLATVAAVYSKGSLQDIETGQTGAMWELVRDHATKIDAAPLGGEDGVNLALGSHAEYLHQQRVGARFFRVLGVSPLLGREWTRAEDVPGGPAVAVLSYGLWQRLFAADPAVVGRTIQLRGQPFTISGVMPRGFRTDIGEADLWSPLRPTATGEGEGDNYGIVARLHPGVTWSEANGELQSVFTPFFAGRHLPDGAAITERVVPMQTANTAGFRREFTLMWAAVLLVLLIGCLNVAGLLIARSSGRTREIATRIALGAGRLTVASQLMAESLLLALAGGALGLCAGYAGLALLKHLSGGIFDLWRPITLDTRVMLSMLALSAATSIVFGLIPAFDAARLDIRAGLTQGSRAVAGGGNLWKRRGLVLIEVTCGVTLLVSAGLLIRTFHYLTDLPAGFDPANVLTAQVTLQDARYATAASVDRLFRESLNRIREIPGVESAAVALSTPYQRPLNMGVQRISGRPDPHGITNFTYATPGMFATLRIPLLQGRLLSPGDNAKSQRVIDVNQAFVNRYLGGHGALGTAVRIGGVDYVIVGVVGNVQQRNGWGHEFGPLAPLPQAYVPVSQLQDALIPTVHTWFSPSWIVRTRGPVTGLSRQIQEAIAAVDPLLPVSAFKDMTAVRNENLQGQRYRAFLFTILAGLAVFVSALGIYGLIAQAVAQRTREMGIRIALGATLRQVIQTSLAPGLLLTGAGIVLGLIGGSIAGRLLGHLLYGIRGGDAVTYMAVAAIFIAVTALASLIPALRLVRLDAAQVLREE